MKLRRDTITRHTGAYMLSSAGGAAPAPAPAAVAMQAGGEEETEGGVAAAAVPAKAPSTGEPDKLLPAVAATEDEVGELSGEGEGHGEGLGIV